MADDQTNPSFQDRADQGRRSGRPSAGREPGGFRIRLSDNEMRAARAVQETFRLRSTVAALGFALRTTAQLLEEGKLDALIEQQRSQAPARGDGPRGTRRDGRSDGRPERGPRVDPFARPSRPAAASTPEAPSDLAPEHDSAASEPADTPISEMPSQPVSEDVSAAEPAGEA